MFFPENEGNDLFLHPIDLCDGILLTSTAAQGSQVALVLERSDGCERTVRCKLKAEARESG
jgi:hypothetical protein